MTQEEKPTLATHITKHARHQLVRFCLTSIRSEYDDMPLTRKTRRGRPPSPENRLASRLGVSTRTVRRWSSGQEAIQSSDENAEKLAALAYVYNQEETILLLREDAERYRMTVEDWLGYMESNTATCPCPEKQGDMNQKPTPTEAQQ